MGKKSSKAPKPPDPVKTAAAQTATNIGTALAQGAVNRVNQVTPDASLIYSQSGTTAWTDPLTGKTYQIPNYTATTALSPEQQRIKAETDAAEFKLANAANTMSGKLNREPFKVNDEVETRLFDLGSQRLAPRLEEARRRAETDAANRGLRLGSEAYDRRMRNVNETENDAFNQLALSGRAQAYAEADTDYNRDLNRITALLSGSQVRQPNFVNTPQASVASTPYAQLESDAYQNKLAAWQRKQQDQQSMLGGLFTAASIPFLYSDKRLKTDISKVGETPDDIGIFRYRYKGGGPLRLGLLAQDVEKRKPDAVSEDAAGYKMVNYRKALRLGERERTAKMDFDLFDNKITRSPEEISARRALVRALMMRQLNQRPRDMWDGISNLVGAISSRIAQNRLDKTEREGHASAKADFAPLIEALRKKQTTIAGSHLGTTSNPRLNPGQRAIAEVLYRRQVNAKQAPYP